MVRRARWRKTKRIRDVLGQGGQALHDKVSTEQTPEAGSHGEWTWGRMYQAEGIASAGVLR